MPLDWNLKKGIQFNWIVCALQHQAELAAVNQPLAAGRQGSLSVEQSHKRPAACQLARLYRSRSSSLKSRVHATASK